MHIERIASKMGLFLYYPCLYRPVQTLQNVLGLLIEVLPHSPVSTDWFSFATLEKRRLRLVASTYYGCGKKRRNTIKHYIIMRTFPIRKFPYLYLAFSIQNFRTFYNFLQPILQIFQLIMSQQPSQNLEDKVYSRQQYARATFWQDRYVQNGGFFDWYAEFPQLQHSFKEYGIIPENKILMVGCGNSKLSDQMYQNGYKNIVNIDISPTVIQQMKQKFPYMIWQVMDATKMSYKDGQFDAIIDKGTLDALISGKNYDICHGMLKQCMRVTKQTGQMILITYGSPQGRRKIFQNALPFNQYDYYQCRAELNDMSTMINLMRSNIPGGQLSSIIHQQEAFAKTMKEFTIIKMMRRARKNQKQYIVWQKHQIGEIQFNSAHLQQVSKQNKVQEEKKEQNIEVKQKVQEKIQEKQEKKQQKKSFNYAPKKQPYVYVYSIRPKFTLGIEEQLKDETEQTLNEKWIKQENGDLTLNGNPQQHPLTFLVQQKIKIKVLQALKFLQKRFISYPTVFITSSPQRSLNNSLKINVVQSKSSNTLCLRKTNILLRIALSEKTTLQNVISKLKNIDAKLINKSDIHPTPQAYSFFNVLKERKNMASLNQFLKKYWFPTWRILQSTQKAVSLQFSLPPLVPPKQQQIISTLLTELKPLKVKVDDIRPGFISYIDLDLLNIVSTASLSYINQRSNLVVEDFWQKDHITSSINQTHFIQNDRYNLLPHTVTLPTETIPKVLAHIVGLY